MARTIELRPKYVLALPCLLLVLAAGIVVQTVAQSTTSLDLTVSGVWGSSGSPVYFQGAVNGATFCLSGVQTQSYPSNPVTVQMNGGYDGSCESTTTSTTSSFYDIGGGRLGVAGFHPSQSFSVTGTVTLALGGSGPVYPFTLLVDFTAGSIVIHSKVTGNVDTSGGGCSLSNLVSQYTSVTGGGVNLNLALLSTSGSCSAGKLVLSLTFSNAPTAPKVAPVAVGGVMLPGVGFSVLLPWALVLSLLGVLSVEAFRIRRRAKRR